MVHWPAALGSRRQWAHLLLKLVQQRDNALRQLLAGESQHLCAHRLLARGVACARVREAVRQCKR